MLGGASTSGIRPSLGVSDHHDSTSGRVLACHFRRDAINVSRAANSGLRPALMEVETYTCTSYPRYAELRGWCIVLQANVHGTSRYMRPVLSHWQTRTFVKSCGAW